MFVSAQGHYLPFYAPESKKIRTEIYIKIQSHYENGGIPSMQITDVKVRKLFDDGPMKAIVSVTFDGQLALHDIKVITAREKTFITMPSRKNADETYRDIAHPINVEFRRILEDAVLAAYEKAREEAALVTIE